MSKANPQNPKSELDNLRATVKQQAAKIEALVSQAADLTKKLEASEKSVAYHKKEYAKYLAQRLTLSHDPSVN